MGDAADDAERRAHDERENEGRPGGAPTTAEIEEARRRLAPYFRGYPEPMIDSRRLRIANGTASEQDRREVRAEDYVIRDIERKRPGPIEQTERMAEDDAIRFLLDGLEVESIRELKRLVDIGRRFDQGPIFGTDDLDVDDDSPVLGRCPHGVDLDRAFCDKGCRV